MRHLPLIRQWLSCFPAALLFALSAPVFAQQEDVTFFVIGKHANFDQSADGSREPFDFSFFAEIFLTEKGDADNAFMDMPPGTRMVSTESSLTRPADHSAASISNFR